MQWWDHVAAWLQTDSGHLVLLGGVVPFTAILISGILAAAIARGSVARLLARRDREAKAATIGLLVDVARQSSVWASSSPGERILIERAVAEADLALRLLPIAGAPTVAEWAASEIAGFRRASVTFSAEFDLPLAEFRDRLIDWYRSPRRARKAFERDLSRWRDEDAAEDRMLREQEDAQAAESARRSTVGVEPSSSSSLSFSTSAPLAGTDTTSVEPLRSFRKVESPTEPGQVESPLEEDFGHPVPAFRGGARAPEASPRA
jgi:hypothetical protein